MSGMAVLKLGSRFAFPSRRWRPREATTGQALLQYIENLERASAMQPDSADLRTCLGLAYVKNHDFCLAKASFESALRSDPGHFFARLRYAELCFELGAYAKAEGEAERASCLARTKANAAMVHRLLRKIRAARFLERTSTPVVPFPKLGISSAVFTILATTLLGT